MKEREIMDKELIEEKHRAIKELSAREKAMLFHMMQAFQEAAQETIQSGNGLLKMCDGCAFKKGSEANNHPYTVLHATECVIKEEPFFCHKRFRSDGSEKLCSGWVNVVNNK